MKYLILVIFSLSLHSELKETSITVYNNNFAAVNQSYEELCQKGRFDLTIKNMPSTLISDSINISLPEYLSLSFQSYKQDSSDYLNQNVNILTKDNNIISGILYKFDGENYVIKNEKEEYLLISKDYIKYLNYGKFDEIDFKNRMVNNGILRLSLNSKKSEKCSVKINYLVNNISWTSSYDAYVDENETSLDLNARIIISNNTGYNFKNSKISLVAGVLNRAVETPSLGFRSSFFTAKSMETDSVEEIKEEKLSDFYAYDLPFNEITISNNETISVDMFSRKGVKFDKIYIYKGQKDYWYFYDNLRNYRYDKNLTSQIIFTNSKENSLGMALPEGKLRVYRKKGEFISLIGEDKIPHTPQNEKITINLGKAFDLSGERKIINHEKIRPNVYRDTIEITIKNEKNENVKVKIKEYLWGNWKIIETTNMYEKIDANNIEFNLDINKKSKFTVKYTVEYDFNQ